MFVRRIFKGFLFFAGLAILAFLIAKCVPLNAEYDYTKMSFEGKDALLKNTPSPRMIFFGGSNVAYGIDGEKIENETGYHVVNMAVAAPYRYKIYMDLLENINLNSKDIIVFLPEYVTYQNDLPFLYRLIVLDPVLLKYFDFPQDYSVGDFLAWTSTLGVKYFDNEKQHFLWSDVYDAYGDVDSSKTKEKDNIECEALGLDNSDFQYNVDMVNKFAKTMDKKGIKVLFSFPSFIKDCYNGDQKTVISDFYSYVKDHAKFPVLGTPERYLFDKSLILDTHYHVNLEGRKIRTAKLLEDMRQYLPSSAR